MLTEFWNKWLANGATKPKQFKNRISQNDDKIKISRLLRIFQLFMHVAPFIHHHSLVMKNIKESTTFSVVSLCFFFSLFCHTSHWNANRSHKTFVVCESIEHFFFRYILRWMFFLLSSFQFIEYRPLSIETSTTFSFCRRLYRFLILVNATSIQNSPIKYNEKEKETNIVYGNLGEADTVFGYLYAVCMASTCWIRSLACWTLYLIVVFMVFEWIFFSFLPFVCMIFSVYLFWLSLTK